MTNFNLFNSKPNVTQPEPLDNIGTSHDKPISAYDAARRMVKKIIKYILIGLLPFFFVFIVIFAAIVAVLHYIDPTQYTHLLSTLHVQAQAGSFIDDVLGAIESVIYVIFIHPILWLLQQFETVIFFIGGGTLSNEILFNNTKQTWGVPTEYWIILMIAIGLIFIFLGMKLIMIMAEQQNQKGRQIRRTIQVFFLIIIALVMIPITFFFFNTLINLITKIIIKGSGSNQNIGLLIFNNSFNNGIHHFTSVPDSFSFSDHDHFNYIICLFSEGFMMYVFLLIIMNLFTRVFELFLFYCISPLVVVSTIADTSGGYPHLRNWINLVTQRFLLFTFIFLAYNIFLNALTLFASIADQLPNTTTQPIFVLLGILGAGIVCVKTPTLLSAIIGGKTSLVDSIGHLSTLAVATSGIKAGALWTSAALVGSRSGRLQRAQNSGTNNFLSNAGGVTGFARGATSAVTTGVGAVSRPDRSLRMLKTGIAGAAAGVGAYYATKFVKAHKKKPSLNQPVNSNIATRKSDLKTRQNKSAIPGGHKRNRRN